MELIAHRYEVVKKLGEGGFGAVYLGRHRDLETLYAVKLLKGDLSKNESFMERFKREARILTQLVHKNSVQLRDFGKTDEGHLYMAMDFCQGQSLQQVLKSKARIVPGTVLEIALQCLSVLEEAHQLGIVHRDLKPDNIMLEQIQDNRVTAKILDFGIAKLVEEMGENNPTLTQDGAIVGTPLYMSPEQASGDSDIDARSDIYSLGLIMYQLVTGRPPFRAASVANMLRMQITQDPLPFGKANPELSLPPVWEEVIFRAIQKERDDRYPDATSFYEAVEGLVETLPPDQRQGVLALPSHQRTRSGEVETEDSPVEASQVQTLASSESPADDISVSQVQTLDSSETVPPSPSVPLATLGWIGLGLLLAVVFGGFSILGGEGLTLEIHPSDQVRTNEKTLEITGKVSDSEAEVYVDDKPVGLQGKVFTAQVSLVMGDQTFSITVKNSAGKEIKKKVKVYADFSPPQIDLSSPPSTSSTSPTLIKGMVKDDSTPIEVKVQGKSVAVKDGKWEAAVSLVEGVNHVVVESRDQLGNIAKKTVSVKYNPYPGFVFLRKATYEVGGVKNTVSEYRHEKTGIEFVLIPGGTFEMGSRSQDPGHRPSEGPVRKVEVPSFMLAKYELTQEVWRKVMGTEPWEKADKKKVATGDRYPAVYIHAGRINSFMEKTGLRLPSEAEWEYACRGGTTTQYFWGDEFRPDYGWFRDNVNWSFRARPVGSKKPNPYGLYDIVGNVNEVCDDLWHNNYKGAPTTGKPWTENPDLRFHVFRGGSVIGVQRLLRSASRMKWQWLRHECNGFRLAWSPPRVGEKKADSKDGGGK